MNPRSRRLRRQRRKDRRDPFRDPNFEPYVCPGCYAVNGPCLPGCIDLEMREGDVYDGNEFDSLYDEDCAEGLL